MEEVVVAPSGAQPAAAGDGIEAVQEAANHAAEYDSADLRVEEPAAAAAEPTEEAVADEAVDEGVVEGVDEAAAEAAHEAFEDDAVRATAAVEAHAGLAVPHHFAEEAVAVEIEELAEPPAALPVPPPAAAPTAASVAELEERPAAWPIMTHAQPPKPPKPPRPPPGEPLELEADQYTDGGYSDCSNDDAKLLRYEELQLEYDELQLEYEEALLDLEDAALDAAPP